MALALGPPTWAALQFTALMRLPAASLPLRRRRRVRHMQRQAEALCSLRPRRGMPDLPSPVFRSARLLGTASSGMPGRRECMHSTAVIPPAHQQSAC